MRNTVLVLCLALAGCATDPGGSPAGTVDSAFYGRWRNLETKIHRTDGTITTQPELQCTREATQTHTISECSLPNGRRSRVVSRIASLTPTSYELEIVENATNPRSVGLRSRVEYRIAGNRMFATVYPQREGNSPVVKVETIYLRE